MTEDILRKAMQHIYAQNGQGFAMVDKAFAIAEHFRENNEGRHG